MGYGKIAVDTLRWDNAGTPTDLDVGTLATPADLNAKANVASPSFTGDVTLTGASYNVVFDASDNALEFADNAKAIFGDGPDLSIYHDTNNSYLEDSGTGALILAASQVAIWDAAKAETMFVATENGSVDLYHSNSKKLATTAAGVTVSGSVTDDKGDLRSIPQNTQGSAYELLAADAGKHILAGGNITWVDSRHAAGDAITIINNTAGDITITKGTTMYNTADADNNNRTLASRGMATILWASGTVAYISGAGLS